MWLKALSLLVFDLYHHRRPAFACCVFVPISVMGDDTSDILGTHNIPIVRGSSSGRWFGLSFGVKSVFAVVVTLALYLVGRRLWESLLVWREKSYKLCVLLVPFFQTISKT